MSLLQQYYGKQAVQYMTLYGWARGQQLQVLAQMLGLKASWVVLETKHKDEINVSEE